MPTDLPIFALNDRVSDKFGGEDTVVIAVQIDDTVNTKARCVIFAIQGDPVPDFLEEELKEEATITSVASPASFFRDKKEVTDEK